MSKIKKKIIGFPNAIMFDHSFTEEDKELYLSLDRSLYYSEIEYKTIELEFDNIKKEKIKIIKKKRGKKCPKCDKIDTLSYFHLDNGGTRYWCSSCKFRTILTKPYRSTIRSFNYICLVGRNKKRDYE